MKYAVVYQSKSGNTRAIAEQIYDTLETEEKEMIDIDVTDQISEQMCILSVLGFIAIHAV